MMMLLLLPLGVNIPLMRRGWSRDRATFVVPRSIVGTQDGPCRMKQWDTICVWERRGGGSGWRWHKPYIYVWGEEKSINISSGCKVNKGKCWSQHTSAESRKRFIIIMDRMLCPLRVESRVCCCRYTLQQSSSRYSLCLLLCENNNKPPPVEAFFWWWARQKEQ